MKWEGFPAPWYPWGVIPAHAGIQVCSSELTWISASAAMTEPGDLFIPRSSPHGYFFKESA
jgi:hypothetical protein